jgi:hypothetical protein
VKGDEMGQMIDGNEILDGNPERMRPLQTPRHRWEDNIVMDIKEIGYENVVGNFLISLAAFSSSRRTLFQGV